MSRSSSGSSTGTLSIEKTVPRTAFALECPKPNGSRLALRGGFSGMLEAWALSDKGCVRSNNEDYCLIEPENGLYVLADGMGGAKAGECASRMAVDTVAEIVHA